MEIKKGDKFRCIKTICTWYITGKIYKSDWDNCITDEQGNSRHEISKGETFMKYFIPYISNKRSGHGRKEREKI